MPEIENTILPPSWLDREFVQDSLRDGLKCKKVTVEDLNIKPAVAAGDNYASQMFRAEVVVRKGDEENKEKMSIIIKCLPKGEHMQETVQEYQLFFKETNMIVEVVPKLQQMLEQATTERFNKLCATCYYHQGPPNDLLIMEDLTLQGYRLASRFDGLDLEHTMLVVEAIARLHATSIVLAEQEPDIVERYKYSFWGTPDNPKASKLVKVAMKSCADAIETMNYFPQKYAKMLHEEEERVAHKTYKSYERDETKLNVLLHGDVWVNNMMFNYDEEDKVKDIVLLDLQLANWNSPVLDLNYFIFTSVQQQVRQHHLDKILKKYHKHFTKVLELLNHPLEYSFEDFIKDFDDRLYFGFISAIYLGPVVCASPTDVVDFDDLLNLDTESTNHKVYQNETFMNILKETFPYFEGKGIIG